MVDIISPQNDRVKLVRALQTQAKARRREGKIVLEGVRLIADALDCGVLPVFVFYRGAEETVDKSAYRLFRQLDALGVPLLSVDEPILDEISALETSPGVLAVAPRPQIAPPATPTLVLVLDQMNNPGNLGSALRTGAAAGAELVILPPNTVDPYNPKVLRGGMGAHFRIPIVQMDWPDIAVEFGGLHTYVAAAEGDRPYYMVDWLRPSLIIIGGEARGAGREARTVAGVSVTIPMSAGTESLNAAVAAGVLLYEVKRQRILSAQEGAVL